MYKCTDCGHQVGSFSRPDECKECKGEMKHAPQKDQPRGHSMFSNADGSSLKVADMHMPGGRM